VPTVRLPQQGVSLLLSPLVTLRLPGWNPSIRRAAPEADAIIDDVASTFLSVTRPLAAGQRGQYADGASLARVA
jgi:hypothetical protein